MEPNPKPTSTYHIDHNQDLIDRNLHTNYTYKYYWIYSQPLTHNVMYIIQLIHSLLVLYHHIIPCHVSSHYSISSLTTCHVSSHYSIDSLTTCPVSSHYSISSLTTCHVSSHYSISSLTTCHVSSHYSIGSYKSLTLCHTLIHTHNIIFSI